MRKTSQTILGALSMAAAVCLAVAPTSASGAAVSLELALVVDESGSVDAAEFLLQQTGYVNAFLDPGIQAAIAAAGGIAVTYIQFDSAATVGVPWMLVNDAASATAFAAAIVAAGRFGNAGTGVAGGMALASSQFGTSVGQADNGFTSLRQVIDVSGDGAENQGGNADAVGDAAIAIGIERINGLVINPGPEDGGTGEPGLLAFYQTQVQHGLNSFTVVADDFDDFAAAVRNKVFIEVTGGNVPEGGSSLVYSLLSVGALGFFGLRRKTGVA